MNRRSTFLFLPLMLGCTIVISPLNNQAIAQAVTTTQFKKVVTHGDVYPSYPKLSLKPGDNATLIKRGEYLAKAGDCIACHTNTKAGGKPFAGGLPINTPFGTIYTPNITSDKTEGIGAWTDAQFIKALRHGISPKDEYYYPAFPFYYFNLVSTKDLIAIRAYLNAVPAVAQQNKKDALKFPFNHRFMLFGWRLLYFTHATSGPYKPNKTKSVQWNRGAYLVQGLGHCSMCHTPSHYLFSKKLSMATPVKQYYLTGALTLGSFAPNITGATLSKVPIDAISDVFLKDRLVGGGQVKGPMLEVNHDSLSYLNQHDLRDIALYLQSIKSKSPVLASAGSSKGKQVYETYCVGCHETGAGGAPKYGDAAAWDPILKKGFDKVYHNALHGIGGMPAKGTCVSCTDQQIEDTVHYMVDAVKGKTAAVPMGEPIKPLTVADAKQVFAKNCSSCHAKTAPVQNLPLGNKAAWANTINAGFVDSYMTVTHGLKGHPVCKTCNDAEIKATLKYMFDQASQGSENYRLW